MIKLEKGDYVVMQACAEADIYPGRTWRCRSDQFTADSGNEVVFLDGISGYFERKFLIKLDNQAFYKGLYDDI